MPPHPSSLAPGMFGTLRADNLRTQRWDTHHCTHRGASPRESQRGRAGWEGGREVLAWEDLDGVRDQRCPVPAQPL